MQTSDAETLPQFLRSQSPRWFRVFEHLCENCGRQTWTPPQVSRNTNTLERGSRTLDPTARNILQWMSVDFFQVFDKVSECRRKAYREHIPEQLLPSGSNITVRTLPVAVGNTTKFASQY